MKASTALPIVIYLLLLLVFLLEDVTGGVDHGLHGLAVVLLVTDAEMHGTLAAQLQCVHGHDHGQEEEDEEEQGKP